MTKTGRNEPCPCGSGKKYKRCCLPKETAPVASLGWQRLRRTEGELVQALLKHADRHYGPSAVAEAWDEFTLHAEVPMDPDAEPEMETAFIPWFVFNWIPDNTGVEEAEHFPEMQVALHYLEREGSRIDRLRRLFIEEACAQPYSFFVVRGVDPGEGMTLRDLLLRREVYVHERQASSMLTEGSIIFARVVDVDGIAIMVGLAPTVIPTVYLTEFIDMREELEERVERIDRELILENDYEFRNVYYDIREQLRDPVPPELHNTDGDRLQFTTLHYALECTPAEALDALATLALVEGTAELTDGARFDAQGGLVAVDFTWLKKGNSRNPGWENTALGAIAIDGDSMTIEVNSQERAETAKSEVTRRLGKRARFLRAVIQSPEKMLESAASGGPGAAPGPPGPSSEELAALPEVQEKIREMAERHWKEWVDTPLPALKGQTPREAAKNASGRERLEALFMQFGQYAASPRPFDPDLAALRRELGLD